jgi:hypothetical protein
MPASAVTPRGDCNARGRNMAFGPSPSACSRPCGREPQSAADWLCINLLPAALEHTANNPGTSHESANYDARARARTAFNRTCNGAHVFNLPGQAGTQDRHSASHRMQMTTALELGRDRFPK